MRLLLMADQWVGLEITRWLIDTYPADVAVVITTAENEVWEAARGSDILSLVYVSARETAKAVREAVGDVDLGLLAWWPKLVKPPLLRLPKNGFVNTHPSLLPFNRGKHYNFWALVERAPFGVSLHLIDEGVDSGDVVAQRSVPYDWEDNGATLYAKAREAMVRLVCDTYPLLRSRQFARNPQDLTKGSFHRSAEIEEASRIELERSYRARDLLNLLRARTFPGHPACWFIEAGETFDVRVEIQRRTV